MKEFGIDKVKEFVLLHVDGFDVLVRSVPQNGFVDQLYLPAILGDTQIYIPLHRLG